MDDLIQEFQVESNENLDRLEGDLVVRKNSRRPSSRQSCALVQIPQLRPDVVTLDIEMPA